MLARPPQNGVAHGMGWCPAWAFRWPRGSQRTGRGRLGQPLTSSALFVDKVTSSRSSGICIKGRQVKSHLVCPSCVPGFGVVRESALASRVVSSC